MRHACWRVRPDGPLTSSRVSTVMPLAFGVRLLKFGRLLRVNLPGSVLWELAYCHAIARIATVAADHLGHVPRSVFTKASIERGIHTPRIGLPTIFNCNLLSLDMENAFNTISHRSFLAKCNKNPNLQSIIPLVEIVYTPDCLYGVLLRPQRCFTLIHHGSFSYGCRTKRSSWSAYNQYGDQQPPPEYWGTVP
jgi:hypothetical protein